MINTVLMDLRTPPEVWGQLAADMAQASEVIGIDCETQDEGRHPGLNAYNTKVRHVFDHRRTVMTGFSVYPGGNTAYYFNLAHADEENRLPVTIVPEVIGMKPSGVSWVSHNAPFELVMFEQCLGIVLRDVICSLQMAVSAHGPDNYPLKTFYEAPLNGIRKIIPDILQTFGSYDKERQGRNLTPDQQFVLGQFIGKSSEATHSYNGFVDEIAWGYSLKRLTASLFGAKQTTFQEVLNGREHMGELTGEEVAGYGAEDAYWAVRVYYALLQRMLQENPNALVIFLERENPMIYVYAETWRDGLRINTAEVFRQRGEERANYAKVLRDLKAQIRQLLPFKDEPNPELIKWQGKWYPKHWKTKRDQLSQWALSPDCDDDFAECYAISNPIGNAWATEQGLETPKGRLNITHYYAMRVLLHDLLGHKLVRVSGEITTDSDARARMLLTFEDDPVRAEVLRLITKLSQTEQVMKLYLTPYTQLLDPETGCLYSVISSMLASRRMAGRTPNSMQLAKRGESTYVRGFYLADSDDDIIVSADWSSVELVEIGEFSGDPEFARCFGQVPYEDLHSGATVDCLKVDPRYSWLTEEEFLAELKRGRNPMGRDLRDFSGKELAPAKWVKFMRTEIGKGANFNYWYSGALSTIAEKLGWAPETHWSAVDRYRERFWTAECWRVNLIDLASKQGFIQLPDGHRRDRFECTDAWYTAMRRKFADICADPSVIAFADLALPKLQRRAQNQIVNSYIQGMCARLAKDSILNLRELADRGGYRFMMPIHDELVFSVKRDYAMEFIPLLRQAMCSHPKYIRNLPLTVNVAVGRTFKPYDSANPRFSQIELDEAPVIEGVIPEEFDGKVLPPEIVEKVLEWL